MLIGGIDFSSHAVDLVTIQEEDGELHWWDRFPLHGNDAFERTRSISVAMPGPNSQAWDDFVAIGIEAPAGRYGVATMTRLQGAILACLPSTMLVMPLPPARWKKLVGLPGYADKETIAAAVRLKLLLDMDTAPIWPQDACDAFCIAQATRTLLEQEVTT